MTATNFNAVKKPRFYDILWRRRKLLLVNRSVGKTDVARKNTLYQV